jgi:hypothetical protein
MEVRAMPLRSRLRFTTRDGLLVVLFLATLWGAVEALVGGVLHRILPPTYPGHVMLALAMGILTYAVRTTGRPAVPTAMALVAAPMKLLSGALFVLPWTAPEVLNPALAILAEGLAVSVLAALFWRPGRDAALLPVAAGAAVLQWFVWVALVRGIGTALYPPDATLAALGAKVAPAWAKSWAGIAGTAPQAMATSLVAGLLGGTAAVALPRPAPLALRPRALAAGTAMCLVVFFVASWTL